MCTCVSCCGPSFAHSRSLIRNLRLPDEEASAQNTRRKERNQRWFQLHCSIPTGNANSHQAARTSCSGSEPLLSWRSGSSQKRPSLYSPLSLEHKADSPFRLLPKLLTMPWFVFSPLWSTSSVSLSDAASSSSSRLPRVMMKSLGPAMSASSADRKSAARPLNTSEICQPPTTSDPYLSELWSPCQRLPGLS